MRVRTLRDWAAGRWPRPDRVRQGGHTDGRRAGGGPTTIDGREADVKVDGSATFDRMTKTAARSSSASRRTSRAWATRTRRPASTPASTSRSQGWSPRSSASTRTRSSSRRCQSAGREQAIINGDVDYYVGTYTITDKRKEQISFAGPYFIAGQDLLVRKDDDSITGPDTLKGKKVCSVTGSTPIQKVRDEELTEPAQHRRVPGLLAVRRQAADQGQVDAVTTDDAILKGYAAQDPDKLKVVGKTFSEEPYGVGLPKDDKALRDKVNDILQAAIDDGTWQDDLRRHARASPARQAEQAADRPLLS